MMQNDGEFAVCAEVEVVVVLTKEQTCLFIG